jgi:two-component system NtrC family response regulator
MIVRIEAIYESGLLKLQEALPLPEHTKVTALLKSPLGTREEEAAWHFIQEGLPPYATEGQLEGSGAAASHNIIDKPLLKVWESPDDIHLEDAMSQWESSSMQEFFTAIRKVARANIDLLILAEGGTEKEMAALAIHKRSTRRDNSFVAIKCGGIPESLLTEELFGFERPANFTVNTKRQGRIANIEGGTLFLDEIDALPPSLQMRILRIVRDHVLELPGGKNETQIDTRVIAATSIDLAQAVREGKFLEELYYQLTVVTIGLPPLRERKADIVVLAQEFLRKHASENCRHSFRFSRDAVSAIENYDWPGNVLELENRVKRAVIMAEGKLLTAADLELESHSAVTTSFNLKEVREAADRELINRALRKHSGSIAPAALEMGISRPTLYELMSKYGIKRDRRGTHSLDHETEK